MRRILRNRHDFRPFYSDASFYEIAKENYLRYVELENELSTLNAEDFLDLEVARHEISTRQHKCGLIAICFSAMCVEAFIYDYAARNTSDSYVQKYLDKLDAVAKWVVIPQLITGKKFPVDSHAFQSLKLLIQTRNKLVHYKSSEVPADQDALAAKLREDEESPQLVKQCFEAIEELFIELRRLDSVNQYEGWYAFPGPYA